MELQRYLEEHSNYLNEFKRQGLKVRKRRHLALVTYPYGKQILPGDLTYGWMKYCRGAIIDTLSHKVIGCPPQKALEMEYGDEIPEGPYEYQPLIDGTMINLCYDGRAHEWVLSTRGDIGAHNRWDKKKSFKQMFEECYNEMDYESLDRGCSYSFVMRHTENRIVAPVSFNEIYLVEVYRIGTEIERLPVSDYPATMFHVAETVTDVSECMKVFDRELPYYIKGFTIKGSRRYKYLNPNYQYVQNLKPNTNNPYLNYLYLRGNGLLREYLSYFPEYTEDYQGYRDTVHRLSNDLYTTYKNVHIYKTLDRKEIPYHMKPLIYEIHGLYLESKEPTTWTHIKDYIHHLPPKKLMFALNYC